MALRRNPTTIQRFPRLSDETLRAPRQLSRPPPRPSRRLRKVYGRDRAERGHSDVRGSSGRITHRVFRGRRNFRASPTSLGPKKDIPLLAEGGGLCNLVEFRGRFRPRLTPLRPPPISNAFCDIRCFVWETQQKGIFRTTSPCTSCLSAIVWSRAANCGAV